MPGAAVIPESSDPAIGALGSPLGAGARVSAADLGELMRAFNDVTARLQSTHETLRAEVSRLEGELRNANEQLRRSERLAALGEMAAGIAHEVRNPLGSIRLYAEMLQQDLGDRPGERDVARKIESAVRGLDAIVGDVLTFARPLQPRRAPADADELFEGALESCRETLDRAGVDAGLGADHQRRVSLRCDSALVRQALVNLVRNASEAADERPAARRHEPARVRLSASRRRVRGPEGRAVSMIALSVADNGPGIPDEIVARMFNPFFTTRAAGTGLGLAIVHRIADAHGGRVGVRQHLDGGAVVELLLPADPSEASNA